MATACGTSHKLDVKCCECKCYSILRVAVTPLETKRENKTLVSLVAKNYGEFNVILCMKRVLWFIEKSLRTYYRQLFSIFLQYYLVSVYLS